MSSIAEDAAALRELRLASETLTREAKEAKEKADHAEQLFFARMESEGIGSIKVADTLFVPTSTVYGQIQDRDAFVKWAEENSPELLEIKERKGLINELVRERLDTGEVFPPGLGFYAKEYVSQRAG